MQTSEDERILAALAHASIIANVVNLAGMIATTLIWATQRERSEFVRQHSLQSLLYQGLVLVISIVLMVFWGLCLGLSLLPVALRPDLYRSSPPNSFWIALLGLALPIGFWILATVYGLYGAYRVYRGRPFYYPIAGRFIRRQSADGAAPRPSPPPAPTDTAHEEAAPLPVLEVPPTPPADDDQVPPEES